MKYPSRFYRRAKLARRVVSGLVLITSGLAVPAVAQEQGPPLVPAQAAAAPSPQMPTLPATPQPATAQATAQLAPAPEAAAAPANALTLEAAVGLALQRNERARSADLRERAFHARIAKARAFFLPSVVLESGYARLAHGPLTRPQEHNTLGTKLDLNVLLFDGRGLPLFRQAKLEHESVDLDHREQKRLLSFDTANAFVASIGQESVLVAAEKRLELAHKSVAQAQSRFAAGLASSNDVTQTELELSAAEGTLVAVRAQTQATRIDLGYLVGVPVAEGALAAPTELLATAEVTAPSVGEALRNKPAGSRLDVRSLRKHAEALAEFAKEPSWRWVPTLSLVAEGRAAVELPKNPDGSLTVKLTWNIWDGGIRTADRDERVALAKISTLDADARSRHVETEVRQAMVVMERGQRSTAQTQHTVELASKNSQETAELYRQGLTTALQVANANQRLFQAEVDLTSARYDMAVGLLSLRAALGLDPFGKEPH